MTQTISALTATTDSRGAGHELGQVIHDALKGAPDALVVFASARHDHGALLGALVETSGTKLLVGSSSAGEFTQAGRGEGQVSAIGIRSSHMRFAMGVGRELSRDPAAAAREAVRGFHGAEISTLPHRSALILTDALAGHTESLLEELSFATGGSYRFFGGGAGDAARFAKTHVFAGTEAISDAVVALEILSLQPVSIGVSHGWLPGSEGLRVTEADGTRLVSLNGAPAVQAYEDHAVRTGQPFDAADPKAFFLHNVLGIETAGNYRLRVPLGVNADGSISCAAVIPEGAVVHIMKTTEASAMRAAERATRDALESLRGGKPSAAIVFDDVATRMRLGQVLDNDFEACAKLLEPATFVGCNSYGQIARAAGQFGGFHNCTAVVGVFPE